MFVQRLPRIIAITKNLTFARSPVSFFCSRAQVGSPLVRKMIAGNEQAALHYEHYLKNHSKAKKCFERSEYVRAKQFLKKAQTELFEIPVGPAAVMQHISEMQSLSDSIEGELTTASLQVQAK